MSVKYHELVIFVVEFTLKTKPNRDFMPEVFIVRVTNVHLWIVPRDFNEKPFWIVIWRLMTQVSENMSATRVDTAQQTNQICIVMTKNISIVND